MKKSTLYVKIIAVAIILTGLLELLPTPANPVEGSAKAFHFNFASEVMTAALLTGAAITIFRAVTQGGKLWSVWRLTALGVIFLALGQIQIPFLEFLGWNSRLSLDWSNSGGIGIIYIIASLILLLGIRRTLQTVGGSTTFASIPAALVAAAIGFGTAALYFSVKHPDATYISVALTSANSILLLLDCLAFGQVYRKLGGLIARPFKWLFASLVFFSLVSLELPYLATITYQGAFVSRGGLGMEYLITSLLFVHAAIVLSVFVHDNGASRRPDIASKPVEA